ncbi:MAG: heme biosynthesis HemY N-terminal domain-containing protein [Legionella sp.]
MIRLAFTLVLLLASIWLGSQLNQDPGYLFIAINSWTLETTLWFALILISVLFLILYVSLATLQTVFRIPKHLQNWLDSRRIKKAQQKTNQGVIQFCEGHWLIAKKLLMNAIPTTTTPLLNYLLAAKAAAQLGDYNLCDYYLNEAESAEPQAVIAIKLQQAELQLANHQWQHATRTLEHLQSIAANHAYIIKLLAILYEETADWQKLLDLLPKIKQKKILPVQEFNRLQYQTYLELFRRKTKANDMIAIKNMFNNLPKILRKDITIIAEYSRYLLGINEQLQVETMLRRYLRKQFDPILILIYGELTATVARFAFVESLLKFQPNSAELLLSLGLLAKKQQLWGKAQQYLQASIAITPTTDAYLALGDIFEQLEEPDQSRANYRDGLLLTITTATNTIHKHLCNESGFVQPE